MLRKDKNTVIITASESANTDSDSVAILPEVMVTMDTIMADVYTEFATAASVNTVTIYSDEIGL